mgnify:CR=1 FL=1
MSFYSSGSGAPHMIFFSIVLQYAHPIDGLLGATAEAPFHTIETLFTVVTFDVGCGQSKRNKDNTTIMITVNTFARCHFG